MSDSFLFKILTIVFFDLAKFIGCTVIVVVLPWFYFIRAEYVGVVYMISLRK